MCVFSWPCSRSWHVSRRRARSTQNFTSMRRFIPGILGVAVEWGGWVSETSSLHVDAPLSIFFCWGGGG